MSRKAKTTLSAVEKLIEQRRLFQDWMEKLAAGVEGMPPHVVERVRNDYRERLSSVMTELAEHRDALREALGEAQERHDALDEQQQQKKDELAELRLRRHVGEMDELAFKEQSGVMQGALDQIRKDLGYALRDIDRYEEILDVIDEGDASKEKAPAPAAPVHRPDLEESAAARTEDGKAGEAARTERRSSPDVKVGKTGVDELAFLRSVTQINAAKPLPTPPPQAPAPQPDGGPRPQPAAAAASAAPAPPPAAPAPSPTTASSTPALSAAPAPAAAETRKQEAAPESVGVVFEAAPHLLHLPPSEHDEPEAAATAPAPAQEEAAGLKCAECGAANRPTEWYCEKCGAELAGF